MSDGWASVSIGSLLRSTFSGCWGSDPRPGRSASTVLRSTDIDDDGHVNFETGAKRVLTARELAEKTLRSGDIILEASGGGPGKPVGRPARFVAETGRDYATSNFFKVLRPNPDHADGRFLAWKLLELSKSPDIWRFQQQTTGIINLKFDDYLAHKLDVPGDTREQARVADVLDRVDGQISTMERVVSKVRTTSEGLRSDLLLGANIAGPRRNSQFGSLPDSWVTRKIDELASHVGSGVTPRGGSEVYQSEGVLFIRSQNVHFDGLRLADVAYISDRINASMLRSEVFPGDVLLNITGASIGRCCVLPHSLGRANVNQHVCAIRLVEADYLDSIYLAAFLSSQFGQRQVRVLNAGGNREGLNYQQIRAFEVIWPSRQERASVAVALSAADLDLQTLVSELAKLKCLRAGLMSDLLSGRVRVPTEGAV